MLNNYIVTPMQTNFNHMRIVGTFLVLLLMLFLGAVLTALFVTWLKENNAKATLQTLKDCFIYLNDKNEAVLLVSKTVSKKTVMDACDANEVDNRYKTLFSNFFDMFEAEKKSAPAFSSLLAFKQNYQEPSKFLKDGLIELIAEDFEDSGFPADYSSFPVAIRKDLRRTVKDLRNNKREADSLDMLRMKLNGCSAEEILEEMLKRNYYVSENTLLKSKG